ncbi:transporter [Roseomonas sp. CCTCC AB2023176]|uniref:transporter n=1 Tax=Roseomonas sp. CCTCC AB2023176 TaxID=3342640 RepID=UPI0035D9D4DA
MKRRLSALALLALFAALPAQAQDVRLYAGTEGAEAAPPAYTGDEALAQQLNNPLATLITVPIQNNFDYGLGRNRDGFRYTAVAQPVLPFQLNADWNIITRTVIPFAHLERVAPDHETGLGDTLASAWISPARPTSWGLTWGVGPAILVPTGTNRFTSTRQYAAGPTAVAVLTRGPWIGLVLANHIWSLGGTPDDRERVSQSFVQAAIAYTTPQRTTYFVSTESTYNATAGQWTVPIQAGVNQLLRVGTQPIQLGGLVRYYAERPEGGSRWGFQLRLTLVFQR